MKFEQITNEQIKALLKMAGPGALVIDWNDLDMELGRGQKTENWRDGHCLFNKDGRRIDIGGYDVGLIVSQTKEADPLYKQYREENGLN